jgi:hypothetical protein
MSTMKRTHAVVLCAALLTAVQTTAFSADEPIKSSPADRKSLHITIYNQNFGLVKDVRELSIPVGIHDVWFEGVAAQIDPTSVGIRSLNAPNDMSVLEQNFEYDLISPKRLMEKYLGRTVELTRTIEDREETVQGKLIGTEGGYVYEIGGKIAIDPPGHVVLPSLPNGLFSKPSLVWMLESRRQKHTVEASYLTDGISWKADYVAVLAKDDKKVDLSGWVTIDNKSGATYADATLKLVAGDVHRIQPKVRGPIVMAQATRAEEARPSFEEESFFEYHLYTLNRKATVRDNQTKQIGLMEASGVGTVKSFVYAPQGRYFLSRMGGPDTNTKTRKRTIWECHCRRA